MKFWFSKKPTTSPDAVTYKPEISGNINGIKTELLNSTSLKRHTDAMQVKRGMWIRHGEHTGILLDIEPDNIVTVMYTHADSGENVLEIHTHASAIRQAYFEEIPIARRPDYQTALKFGYVRK